MSQIAPRPFNTWRSRFRSLASLFRPWPYHFAWLLGSVIRIIRPPNAHAPDLLVADQVPGSCGDMAMMKASAGWLHRHGASRVTVLADGQHSAWHLPGEFSLHSVNRAEHDGIFGLLFRFSRVVAGYRRCFVIGADVMDGGYGSQEVSRRILFANLAATAGRKSTILGCSINATPTKDAAYAWRKTSKQVRVCARDPLSMTRLKALLGREVVSVADVAFLLGASEGTESSKISAWIASERQSGRGILALNLGKQSLRSLSKQRDSIPRPLDIVLRNLARDFKEIDQKVGPLSLVLLPHDIRGPNCDQALLERFASGLPVGLQQHTHLSRTTDPAEIKQLLSYCDALVTGRMHAAIAALGMGTPALGLAYQDKFQGLYELFDIGELVSGACDGPEFVSAVVNLVRRNNEYRDKVKKRLPGVRKLAEQNFEPS